MGKPFVGRERELDQLLAGLDDARAGDGRLFVLGGESGIGKTRLAEEFSRIAAERGVSVIWGRCWEAGKAPAYWPWKQALAQIDADFDLEAKSHRLEDRNEESRFQLFEIVANFLRKSAAEQPIALVLDDLHAADESSLLLMHFLARGLASAGIFMIGTYNPDEARVTPTHSHLLARVTQEGTRLFLEGLDKDAVAALLENLTGYKPPQSVVDTMHEATEGNPFYVQEATRLYMTKGDLRRPDYSVGFRVPEGVKDVVTRRFDALSDELREALSIACVIGRHFDVSLLAEVCGKEADRLRDLLGQSVRAGIVEEASSLGNYTFTHVLLRETLYEDLTPSHRMRLHHETAQALEGLQREGDEALLGELAHHWFKAAQAGDAYKAVSYAVRAAERARSLLAFEESARLYRRALKVVGQGGFDRSMAVGLESALASVESEAVSSPSEPASIGPNVFVKEADFWTVEFGRERAHLRNTKGLGYLARLLANPGRELHALDLLHTVREGTTGGAMEQPGAEDELRIGPDDAGPLLDATAKAAYRRRLRDLQEELEEAESFNDPERATRATKEMDALTQQLAAGIGLGGRDRKAASQAERARVSVQKTVKEALRKIDEATPALGAHLRSTVRTGTFCSYTPDPRVPTEWKL
ncbi:MAG: AAA family ATPase [Actinobacteria bacterium]|nr:AAA family ATPase [Actinomycetota bacterium]